MALLDRFKLYYIIKVSCDNCGLKNDLKVKKGMTVPEIVKNKLARCQNCKCIIKVKEYQTQWLE